MGRKLEGRLIVCAGVAALIAIAGATFLLWPKHDGGISQDRAIQIAWQHVDNGAVAVTSAEVRQDFHTGFDVAPHRRSWVVTFAGQWHLLCQGACDPTSEWVAVDYYTGDWIASQYSYPAGR